MEGREGAVYEPIYEDPEVEAFAETLAHTDRSTLYLTTMPRSAHLLPTRTARVTAAIESDPRWREVQVEAEFPRSPEVRVRKFVR